MTREQELALNMAEALDASPRSLSSVAVATSQSDARWAFTQWSLRRRARAKFALAEQMLFDQDGLEMASHEQVAEYHASKFPAGELVADLTCGIGADLIAIAKRGPAIGFDLDPLRAEYARHNLEIHGVAAEVIVCDSLLQELPRFAFCDPARRSGGRRTLRLSEFLPDPQVLAKRFSALEYAGIKLSPMLSDRDLESFGGRLEFVSFGGECREALVLLPGDGTRRAVHLESGDSLIAGQDPVSVESPETFLFEADPAAIRAHCLGQLGAEFDLRSLGDSNGYLTGSANVNSPWLTSYEVLAFHPADLKRTKSALRRLGGGTPIVKSRGVPVDVQKLRKDLRGDGEELILIVYPSHRSVRHVVCRIAATA